MYLSMDLEPPDGTPNDPRDEPPNEPQPMHPKNPAAKYVFVLTVTQSSPMNRPMAQDISRRWQKPCLKAKHLVGGIKPAITTARDVG